MNAIAEYPRTLRADDIALLNCRNTQSPTAPTPRQ